MPHGAVAALLGLSFIERVREAPWVLTEERGDLTHTGGSWDPALPLCRLACLLLLTSQCARCVGGVGAVKSAPGEAGGMAFSDRGVQNKFFSRTRRRKQEIHNHKI